MDTGLSCVKIERESIEIFDVEVMQEEEAVQNSTSFMSCNLSECDIIEQKNHKEHHVLETAVSNKKANQRPVRNVVENVTDSSVECLKKAHDNSVSISEGLNKNMTRNNKRLNKTSKQSLNVDRNLEFSNKEDNTHLRDNNTFSTNNESNEPVSAFYSCPYCDYRTCFNKMLANHQRRHKILKPWACSKCSYSSVSKFSLQRHVELIHDKPKNIFCHECDFKCSKKRQLKSHMLVHSGKSYFQCSQCDFKHIQNAVLKRHMVIHQDNKVQLMCCICQYKGVKPEYLKRHMEKHHSFEMDFESSYFKENVDIDSSRGSNGYLIENYHKKIIQKQPVVLLKRCDDDNSIPCNSVNMEAIHEQILQDNFLEIAKCVGGKSIDSEEIIPSQLVEDPSVVMKSNLITKNKNVITSIVKVVENSVSTQTEMSNCNSEEIIKGKVFKHEASIHQTEPKPIVLNEVVFNKTGSPSKTTKAYQCTECNFVSPWLDKFDTHVKLKCRKPLSCDKCKFSTKSQLSYVRHKMLKHSAKKSFKCEKCDYQCSTTNGLKKHMAIHEREKDFNCNKCNIKCKTAAALKHHERKHNGEKPFACDLCDFRSKTKIGLKNHMFVHTGETRFVCKICNYKFYSNHCLKTHMETHMEM